MSVERKRASIRIATDDHSGPGVESILQCREHQFGPWFRKTPLALEHLSPCATTPEPVPATAEARVP